MGPIARVTSSIEAVLRSDGLLYPDIEGEPHTVGQAPVEIEFVEVGGQGDSTLVQLVPLPDLPERLGRTLAVGAFVEGGSWRLSVRPFVTSDGPGVPDYQGSATDAKAMGRYMRAWLPRFDLGRSVADGSKIRWFAPVTGDVVQMEVGAPVVIFAPGVLDADRGSSSLGDEDITILGSSVIAIDTDAEDFSVVEHVPHGEGTPLAPEPIRFREYRS